MQIGGELQKQKIALSSILQDAGLAATQFSKIQSLAVRSPFGIMELSQYSKQLASYATPYYELYDTMKRIADISAGVGVDMGRIILAFGQVKNAGFLKGTELRQFTEANIPLLDKLAERFSQLEGKVISTSDVMEMISKRKVGFEDVKEVLFELTEAGGMFYNMQEVLADSLAAKWKNLTDAIHNANLEMADSKFVGGTLKTIAEILTSLAGDWRSLGGTALVAISTFKIFKPASNAFVDALTNATRRTNALAYAAKGLRTGWLKFISVIKTASKELLTFLPTAIISGIVFIGSKLWFDYKKRQEELEEQTQRNRDSYEGLYNSIKKFEGIDWDFSENTERELKEISKELQEILLNHLPNAGEVLNNIFKEDSGLKTYTQQIEALKNEVLALKDAREQLAGSQWDPATQANAKSGDIFGYGTFGDKIAEFSSAYNSLMDSISNLVRANPKKYQKYLIKGKTLTESIFEAIIKGEWKESAMPFTRSEFSRIKAFTLGERQINFLDL